MLIIPKVKVESLRWTKGDIIDVNSQGDELILRRVKRNNE
jgi:antitoxin component of MazEF toxin-antitoxin module